MKSFYEKRRDDEACLAIQRNAENTFPAHIHNNLEIWLIKNGSYEIGVNDKRYRVENGGVIVIDSFDIHSYEALPFRGERDTCVVIIPYCYLDRFHAAKRGMRIAEPLITDVDFCDTLLRFVDDYLAKADAEAVKKAGIELLIAMLAERLSFVEGRTGDERVLMREILVYIQNHFRESASRADIAHALGYTEAHISRVFHRYLHMGISDYVNGLRLDYIERLRAEGDRRSTTELVFEAGFGSQQTYYRAKQKIKQK